MSRAQKRRTPRKRARGGGTGSADAYSVAPLACALGHTLAAGPPPPKPQQATAGDPICDIMCPICVIEMQREHAHYRCTRCGYRDSCCV